MEDRGMKVRELIKKIKYCGKVVEIYSLKAKILFLSKILKNFMIVKFKVMIITPLMDFHLIL